MKGDPSNLICAGYREERRNQVTEPALSCITDTLQVKEGLSFDIVAENVANYLQHQFIEVTVTIRNRLQEKLCPRHLLLAGIVVNAQGRSCKVIWRVLAEFSCVHIQSAILQNDEVRVYRKFVMLTDNTVFQ